MNTPDTSNAKAGSVHSSRMDSLVQPLGGLLYRATAFPAFNDEPSLVTRIENVGDLALLRRPAMQDRTLQKHEQRIQGAGVGVDEREATVRSRGEAIERYCTAMFSREQFIRATADQLGKDALDLETIPQCSETELANPKCPLRKPRKNEPIRWVQSLSLLDGRIVYVPAVMVYLYAGFESEAEQICLPITTGCAAHPSLERALASAILEVIERDAISLTWLQKLPLCQIEMDEIPGELRAYWERYQRSSIHLEYSFFDATTDIGVPTVYGLQRSHMNTRLRTLVSCCAAMCPKQALLGAMREMASHRVAFRRPRMSPASIEDFTDVFHGATYMANAERASEFDFLLNSARKTRFSQLCSPRPVHDDRKALQTLLHGLEAKNLNAYAVELSTDEALRAGLRVVRVLVPGLQPLSFHYRARYLGHPRLYKAPLAMGLPSHPETGLNHWPQPFA